MPQVLVPCWIQPCLPSWKKMIQWCLGGRSFFPHHRWHGSTGLHSERLLQPSYTILHLGPMPQKLTVPPQLKQIPLPLSAPCRGCTHVTMYARGVSELTWLDTWTHVRIFESSQVEGLYVGDLLYFIAGMAVKAHRYCHNSRKTRGPGTPQPHLPKPKHRATTHRLPGSRQWSRLGLRAALGGSLGLGFQPPPPATSTLTRCGSWAARFPCQPCQCKTSVGRCYLYPKEHMLSMPSRPLPEAGPSDATTDKSHWLASRKTWGLVPALGCPHLQPTAPAGQGKRTDEFSESPDRQAAGPSDKLQQPDPLLIVHLLHHLEPRKPGRVRAHSDQHFTLTCNPAMSQGPSLGLRTWSPSVVCGGGWQLPPGKPQSRSKRLCVYIIPTSLCDISWFQARNSLPHPSSTF